MGGIQSTVVCVVCALKGLEMVGEAFLQENLCRERGPGTQSRFEERHEHLLGLWAGGNSEGASGLPIETRCQGLSSPSKAGRREFSGLRFLGSDFLPEFR